MIKMNKINKEKFIEIINALEEIKKLEDDATKILNRLGGDGYFGIYKATQIIQDMLAIDFDDNSDEYDYIGYFIYELEFGKKYKDGKITDENGNFIKLSNAGELYDLLIDNMINRGMLKEFDNIGNNSTDWEF